MLMQSTMDINTFMLMLSAEGAAPGMEGFADVVSAVRYAATAH